MSEINAGAEVFRKGKEAEHENKTTGAARMTQVMAAELSGDLLRAALCDLIPRIDDAQRYEVRIVQVERQLPAELTYAEHRAARATTPAALLLGHEDEEAYW